MSQQELFEPMTADAFDVAKLGSDDMRQAKHRWPQRLAELFDVEFAYNRRKGMDEEAAARDATERVFLVASYVGGRLLYIPNGDKLRIAVRDLQIFRMHGRRSVSDLAREHGLTDQQIYNVVREQTRIARSDAQMQLFGHLSAPRS